MFQGIVSHFGKIQLPDNFRPKQKQLLNDQLLKKAFNLFLSLLKVFTSEKEYHAMIVHIIQHILIPKYMNMS